MAGVPLPPGSHRRRLDAQLHAWRGLWQPQPFRELQPAWTQGWPALAAQVLALSEAEVTRLNDDGAAALRLLASHLPDVGELLALTALPDLPAQPAQPPANSFWDWEIPGRKKAQIEAFAAAANAARSAETVAEGSRPVLDWCGGKGHLGRLLALSWQVPVHSLDFDAGLCAAGAALATRARAGQAFVHADALAVSDWPRRGEHAVALHACGELHRRLIREGARCGIAALDVAPCCYYRGVETHYQPLAEPLELRLSRDDTRLAVTETVTAKARETRLRDQALAWKLGFDHYRRLHDCAQGGAGDYRNFKPVPDAWLRASFAECMGYLCPREGLPLPSAAVLAECERAGWRRRDQLMRYSVVRHAFRRALEIWLALDLAVHLEEHGYRVGLGVFCARELTPRNLLLSARLA